MKNVPTKTIKWEITDVINGLGIVRCECKKVNWKGELYGHTQVWYDVCLDEGYGDCIESFKLATNAIYFAREH